jgi:hypothetical protein
MLLCDQSLLGRRGVGRALSGPPSAAEHKDEDCQASDQKGSPSCARGFDTRAALRL